jgi:cation-transporting P-type ATPase E
VGGRHTDAERPASLGLSQAEATARHRRGEGNVAVTRSSRSYGQILRTNVFSFFDIILFVIGAALLALGRYNDALTSVGLGLVNAAISAVQAIRAKRKLDRLQLLSLGMVAVVRDGQDVELTPEQVVGGDVVHVRSSDRIA